MPDKSALWVFQRLYEPHLVEGDKWAVDYKSQHDNKWRTETFIEHEKAFDFYYAKQKELSVFYNTFLHEIGVRQK